MKKLSEIKSLIDANKKHLSEKYHIKKSEYLVQLPETKLPH